MSKNYKIGSKFRVTSNDTNGFEIGELVKLVGRHGDNLFEMNNGFLTQTLFEKQFELAVGKVSSKLKPAKQALADAIHENGGWVRDHFLFATSNADCVVTLWVSMPIRDGNHFDGRTGNIKIDWRFHLCRLIDRLPNWHQTILSRDEYFTAYPEKAKVEVNNETEHKVEAEMKSESEMTIKVSEWHKNGELPPVGEVCEIHHKHWSNDKFHKVKVLAITYEHLVVRYETFEQHYLLKYMSFRPLRTERDKAIEEMVDCLSGCWVSCEEIAAHLYENGYRKEVK